MKAIYSIDSIDQYYKIDNIEHKGLAHLALDTSLLEHRYFVGGVMERRSTEALRLELVELLRKQA